MLLTHFGKNFVRENFLEKMFEFNGILTKRRVFDKKVVKYIFYKSPFIFYTYHTHRTQNALFKFLM